MTKYILVGGYPKKAIDGGKGFCEELIKGFNKPVKLLDCLYARPKETWDQVFIDDTDFFSKYLPKKSFEIQLADVEKFIEQIKWAEVIFLKGGDTEQLLGLLAKSKDWVNYLDNKTLAGTSAGAEVISKYYWHLNDLRLEEGLGLLPLKVLTHYHSDYNAPNINWDKALQELKNYKENLPICTLAEGEFKVITSREKY